MINLHLIIHYHTIRPLIWSKRTAEVEIVRLTSTTPKLEIWISLTSEETFADLTKMLVFSKATRMSSKLPEHQHIAQNAIVFRDMYLQFSARHNNLLV